MMQGICILYMLSGCVNASTERLGYAWIVGWGAQNIWQLCFQLAYKFTVEEDKDKMLIFHLICFVCLLASFSCFFAGFYRVIVGYRQDYLLIASRYVRDFMQTTVTNTTVGSDGSTAPPAYNNTTQEKQPLITGFTRNYNGSLEPVVGQDINSGSSTEERNPNQTQHLRHFEIDREVDLNPGASYLIYMISSVNAAWLSVATLIGMLVTIGAFNGVYDDVALLHIRYQLPTYINLAVILLVPVMAIALCVAFCYDTFSYTFTIMWALYGIIRSDNVVPDDLRIFASNAFNTLSFAVFVISLYRLMVAFAMLHRQREIIIV